MIRSANSPVHSLKQRQMKALVDMAARDCRI